MTMISKVTSHRGMKFSMRWLYPLAAVLVLALAVFAPGRAHAATKAPATVGQYQQAFFNWAFYNPPNDVSTAVHSTTNNNWYQTNNGNFTPINPTGSGTWQLLKDQYNPGWCLTFVQSGSQADEVIDVKCDSTKYSELWASASKNTYMTTWYFWNRYEITHDTCAGGHNAFITGTGAVSTWYVECPNSDGSPKNDQLFNLQSTV